MVLAPFVRCASCCCVIPAEKSFAAIKMDVCERVNSSERRLFLEQIATVVGLGCGRKVDAMWHVPQTDKSKHFVCTR